MKNDQTEILYNEVLKNAGMGEGTVTHLLRGQRSDAMRETLQRQQQEYAAITGLAQRALREKNRREYGLSPFERIRTDAAVSMNLLMDSSDSHIAQMLMNGSTMGVINAEKKLHENPDAEEGARALMRRLSSFEEQTLQVMKGFL